MVTEIYIYILIKISGKIHMKKGKLGGGEDQGRGEERERRERRQRKSITKDLA